MNPKIKTTGKKLHAGSVIGIGHHHRMIMIYVCILYVSTYATADELMARGERANDAKWQRWGHKAHKVERERTFVRMERITSTQHIYYQIRT